MNGRGDLKFARRSVRVAAANGKWTTIGPEHRAGGARAVPPCDRGQVFAGGGIRIRIGKRRDRPGDPNAFGRAKRVTGAGYRWISVGSKREGRQPGGGAQQVVIECRRWNLDNP